LAEELAARTAVAHQTVTVPMHASVTAGVILLAVLLAIAGRPLAGVFGSWRIGQLRSATALAQVDRGFR
jgi:hypothetical protein